MTHPRTSRHRPRHTDPDTPPWHATRSRDDDRLCAGVALTGLTNLTDPPGQPIAQQGFHARQVTHGDLFVGLVGEQRAARAKVDGRYAQRREPGDIRPPELGMGVRTGAGTDQLDQRTRQGRVETGSRGRRFVAHLDAESAEHASRRLMLAVAQFGAGVLPIIRALACARVLSGANR